MFDRKFFAENLKELIKERDKTQRKLADYLHHENTKTISKWVNGRTSPSVDDVVKIATYFDVSVDELLGCNQERREKKKNEYSKEISKLFEKGDIEACISKCNEALNEFPKNIRFEYKLMWALAHNDKIMIENANRIIELGNGILKRITGNEIRDGIANGTIQCLCKAYSRGKGNYRMAESLAETVPDYYGCQDELLADINQGGLSQVALCQKNIKKLVELIGKNIQQIVDDGTLLRYDFESVIYMIDYALKNYQSLYPDGDYGSDHCRLVNLNLSMHKIQLLLGEREKAIQYLEKAAEHAVSYDTQKGKGKKYTSPMVRHAGEIKYNLIKNYIQSERDKVLSDIQKYYETLGEKPLKVLEIEKKLKSFST